MSRRDGKQSRMFRQFALRYWHNCQWCGHRINKNTATTDHIIPLGRNGTNHIWNMVLACQRCNNDRGDDPVDRPLLGPRWDWPDRQREACVFVLPLTRYPVVSLFMRRNSFSHQNNPHTAFPLQLPVTVSMPPLYKGGPSVEAKYEPGDRLVMADTGPNNDPLVVFMNRDKFESDYAPVPYESQATAARGGVKSVKLVAQVEYNNGETRTVETAQVGSVAPHVMRRQLLDAAANLACNVAVG